jgi:hypothetical protein
MTKTGEFVRNTTYLDGRFLIAHSGREISAHARRRRDARSGRQGRINSPVYPERKEPSACRTPVFAAGRRPLLIMT